MLSITSGHIIVVLTISKHFDSSFAGIRRYARLPEDGRP